MLDMKFEKLAEEWLKYKKPSVKTTTYSNYYGVVQNRLVKKFKGQTMRQLSKYDYNDYVIKLMNKGLKNKTIKDTVIILKQILKYADLKYGVRINTKLINTPRMENKEKDIFNTREYKKLKKKLIENNDHKILGVMFGLFAGMRIGEVCGLRWKDIDFDNKVIRVNNIVVRVKLEDSKSHKMLTEPKTDASKRAIPMSEIVNSKLKELSKYFDSEAFIITGKIDEFAEPITYERIYYKYLDKIKVRYKSFHTLRHTFATTCIKIGMPVKQLSLILGHTDVAITLRYYVHPDIKSSVKFLNQL